jgi:hypothetical protein
MPKEEREGRIPCLPRSPLMLLYICWNKEKHVNKPKEKFMYLFYVKNIKAWKIRISTKENEDNLEMALDMWDG